MADAARRLRSGDDATAGDELLALHDELAARVLDGAGPVPDDERLAFLVASAHLSATAATRGEGPDDALAWIEDALAARHAGDPPVLAAWFDYEHASRLVEAGRVDDATEVLSTSLSGGARGTPYELPSRHLLAECLRRASRWREAEQALGELGARLDELALGSTPLPAEQLHLWRARLDGSRGQLDLSLGLVDRAAQVLAHESEEAHLSGDPQALATSILNRVDLGLMTEDDEGMQALLLEAQEAPFQARLDPAQRALFEVYLGVARSQAEDEAVPDGPGTARTTLEAALASPVLSREARIVALRHLARLELHRGELADAGAALERAHDVLTRVDDPDALVEDRAVLAAYAGELALASGADHEELQRRADELRAGWTALLEHWGRTPVRPGGVGFLYHSARREVLGTLARLSIALDGREAGATEALERFLEAEALGTLARRLQLPRATLEEVRRELLRDGEGVLIFLPSRERSHLIALDREHVHYAELPRWDDLRADLEDLLARLRRDPRTLRKAEERTRQAEQLERGIRAISGALLPEQVWPWMESWHAVTVLGTQYLRGLPPEILRVDGEPLGTTRAVDVLPSLTLGLAIVRRPRAPVSRDLALVATLDPGAAAVRRWPGIEAAPVPGELLARLAQPFPSDRVWTLAGPAVTREAVLHAPLADAAILHVLAHGAWAADEERGATLVLSGDGDTIERLSCADVEGLPAPGIVLLSACSSARGPGRPGDDALANLGGAFLAAGARAVVLAQAPVQLQLTTRLMEHAQERLAAGDSVAEALRSARAAVAADGDPLAAVAAAQFSVVGAGQRTTLR